MAVSQNGYRANDRSLIVSISVPGGKLAVRKGDVAVIMQYVAEQFHSTVEPLKWPGNWGYAERKIRGGSSLSNHASGTAIDLNAPKHYLGAVGTFTSSQVRAIRKILSACEGTIRWGGDYRGRKDEMHFEINAGTAKVARVAKKLRPKLQGPSIPGGGGGGGSTYTTVTGSTPLVKLYHKGEPVKRIQAAVGVKVDGYYGPDTANAVAAFQKKLGLAADKIVGPDTWAAINGSKPKPAPKPKGKPFPLPKGHFYYTEDRRNTVHSGYWAKDRPAIREIQKKVGTGVDGGYGAKTKAAVLAWQRKNGLKADGAVGISTWKRMFG